MSQTSPNPPPGFDDLSVKEQFAYLQSLWDRIAAHPEEVPLPDWHKEILTARLATHSLSKPWEELQEELLSELKEPRDQD